MLLLFKNYIFRCSFVSQIEEVEMDFIENYSELGVKQLLKISLISHPAFFFFLKLSRPCYFHSVIASMYFLLVLIYVVDFVSFSFL